MAMEPGTVRRFAGAALIGLGMALFWVSFHVPSTTSPMPVGDLVYVHPVRGGVVYASAFGVTASALLRLSPVLFVSGFVLNGFDYRIHPDVTRGVRWISHSRPLEGAGAWGLVAGLTATPGVLAIGVLLVRALNGSGVVLPG